MTYYSEDHYVLAEHPSYLPLTHTKIKDERVNKKNSIELIKRPSYICSDWYSMHYVDGNNSNSGPLSLESILDVAYTKWSILDDIIKADSGYGNIKYPIAFRFPYESFNSFHGKAVVKEIKAGHQSDPRDWNSWLWRVVDANTCDDIFVLNKSGEYIWSEKGKSNWKYGVGFGPYHNWNEVIDLSAVVPAQSMIGPWTYRNNQTIKEVDITVIPKEAFPFTFYTISNYHIKVFENGSCNMILNDANHTEIPANSEMYIHHIPVSAVNQSLYSKGYRYLDENDDSSGLLWELNRHSLTYTDSFGNEIAIKGATGRSYSVFYEGSRNGKLEFIGLGLDHTPILPTTVIDAFLHRHIPVVEPVQEPPVEEPPVEEPIEEPIEEPVEEEEQEEPTDDSPPVAQSANEIKEEVKAIQDVITDKTDSNQMKHIALLSLGIGFLSFALVAYINREKLKK